MEQEVIENDYKRWVNYQYKSDEMRQYTIRGNKISIETNDVDVAIKRISKNKAIGTDNISL